MKKTLVFLSLTATLLLLGLFPSLGASEFTYNEPVDISYDFILDAENDIYDTLSGQGYGTKITLSSLAPAGYEFVTWIVDGVVEPSLDLTDGIIVTKDVYIIGVFRPTSELAVVFMDANGGYLETKYVTSGGSVTPPDISSLSKPGLTVSTEQPWGTANLTNVTADTIAYVNYVISSSETYTVAVTGGTVSGAASANFAFNAVATVVANVPAEGNYFLYWQDAAGNIVSYDATHSFSVYQHAVLTAVFGATPETRGDSPQVFLGNRLDLRAYKSTFIGQYEIPSGYSIVEYGILVGSSSDFTFDAGSTMYFQCQKANGATGEFAMSIDSSAAIYGRAYLIVKSDANVVSTVYSRAVRFSPSELMFSEYGEGSSNNKWLEIYNPSQTATIDLSNYQIQTFMNGSATATYTLELTGTLAPGDVYVVANSSANVTILAAADVTSTVCGFNGDDAIGLYNETTASIVDVIGTIGSDPGTSWAVGSGSTVDSTLVRNKGISDPTASWTLSQYQWTVSAIDTISNIGFHENDNLTSLSISGTNSVMAGNTITLTPVYSPLDADQREVTWSSSNESVATIDEITGIVTGVSAGSVTITCTSSAPGYTAIFAEFSVTVTAPTYYSVSTSVNSGAYGSVVASPSSVLSGGSSTLTFTPATGYYTDYITINGGSAIQIDGAGTYTLTNITSEQSVSVVFDAYNTISVSVNNEAYGSASSSSSSVMDGGSITISTTAASGYYADTISINGGDPVSLSGSTTYQITGITANQSVSIVFTASSGTTEQVIYSTGFESSESFSASTTYNNTTIKYTGPTGTQWGSYFGTPSTTSPLAGLQSMQMRWYSTTPTSLGYAFTNFTLTDATKVEFNAANTSTINVKVSYSIDGGSSYTNAQTFTLTTSSTTYTYNIDASGLDVMLKFEITYSTTPATGARLYLDTIKVYGLR